VDFQRRHPSRVSITASRVMRAWVLACVAMVSVSVSAASFDCAKAKSDMEITVCASPELSALDEQLAGTYTHAKGTLSADGQAMLTNTQRDWLRYVKRVCFEGRSPQKDAFDENVCLGNELRRRVDQLGFVGLRVDGHVLTRVDLYDATPAKVYPDTVGFAGFVVRHVGYPRIDAPPSAEIIEWNNAQAKALPELSDDNDTDYDIDYKVGCAGGRILGLRVETSEYAHGTPHGDWSAETSHAVFAPEIREMTPDDLFVPNADWENKLPDMFWQVYLGGGRVIKDRPEIEPAVREAAAEPGKWLLTADGLQIAFDAYETGCYACNPGPLTVPWATLKPLLKSNTAAICLAPKKED
jgi:uncharacterized protein YecT (DUF1311 family)